MDRKYSVREIDDFRQVMENKYLLGSYNLPIQLSRADGGGTGCVSRCYNEVEKSAVVEGMVRTAMMAGHTADDYRNP